MCANNRDRGKKTGEGTGCDLAWTSETPGEALASYTLSPDKNIPAHWQALGGFQSLGPTLG